MWPGDFPSLSNIRAVQWLSPTNRERVKYVQAGSIFRDSPLAHPDFRGLVSPGGSFQQVGTAGESGPAEVSPETGQPPGQRLRAERRGQEV